jgi:hypothetical protein
MVKQMSKGRVGRSPRLLRKQGGFCRESLSIHSIHVKHFHNLVAVCVAVRP